MKKKTLTIAIALVLVVALAVGATYALLTDKTDTVTNTFTAGKITDDGTVFTLKEHKVTQAADGTYALTDEEAVGGVQYDAVVPGTEIAKDPTVKVEKLKGDAYLYIVVDDTLNAKLGHSIDPAWTPIGSNGSKTLYKLTINDGLLTANSTVNQRILTGDKLVAADDLVPGGLGTITFQAYLIQAVGTTSAIGAWNANGGFDTGISAETPTPGPEPVAP